MTAVIGLRRGGLLVSNGSVLGGIFAFPYKTYVFLFAASLMGCFILTPLVRKLALRLNLVDRPDIRRVHGESVPLLGGLGIFVPFVVLVTSCLILRNQVMDRCLERLEDVLALLVCGTLALALGIYDDARGADAKKKFAVQVSTAILAFALGFKIEGVSLGPWGSIDLEMLSLPFTVAWIVGITNAINIIDGLDGLATGVTLFVCIGNFLVSVVLGNVVMSVVSIALAGALMGFLRYNFPPAKIFLGNTGSLFLGMTLALSSVLSAQKSSTMVMMLIPIAVLGLPILDTSLAIFRRSLLGRPIFVSDKGHIHHALLKLGLSHRKAVLLLYGFCFLLLGFAGVVLLDKSREAAVYLGVIAIVSVAGMRILGYLDFGKIRMALSNRWRYKVKDVFCRLILLKMRKMETVEELWRLLTEAAAEFEIDTIELSVKGEDNDSLLRWENGKGRENGNKAQSRQWRTRKFDFPGGVGRLTLGYYGSPDEDFEVERNYRLELIGHATERRLSELVSVNGGEG